MKGSFLKNVRRYFKQYCNRTSVHGFQYFGEDRSVFERLWWIFFFAICLVVCGFCIFEIHNKWRDSPVIVNFANSETSINQIPFPAVTICSESKTNPKKFSYTETVRKLRETNLTSEEERKLNVLQVMCKKRFNFVANTPTIHPKEFFDDLKELQSSFFVENCIFLTEILCNQLFYPKVTEERICYSFNMIHGDEIFRENVVQRNKYSTFPIRHTNWTLQNGYRSSDSLTSFEYPIRAFVSGVNHGLSFFLVGSRETSDPDCQRTIRGYKMLFHTPITIPRFGQHFVRIPSDSSVLVAVEPQVVKTSKRVQNYSPDRRKCYFETERRLKFFKIYTSSNCKLECLTNYTLFMCGCAAFYMPRENDTEICSGENMECLKNAESEICFSSLLFIYFSQPVKKVDIVHLPTGYMTVFNIEIRMKGAHPEEAEILHEKFPNWQDFKGWKCDCLPTCSELFYEVEVTQSKWDWMDEYEDEKLSNMTLTSVTVYFKSDNFIARERNELYGPLDFLASFGGLIGLFTGFSILSLIEILYFLSVRIIFNRRLYGQWAGLEN